MNQIKTLFICLIILAFVLGLLIYPTEQEQLKRIRNAQHPDTLYLNR